MVLRKILSAMLAAIALLTFSFPGRLAASTLPDHGLRDAAIGDIFRLFDSYELVGLGENHMSVPFYNFLTALITAPDFPDHVQDIVIEGGSQRYQSLVDRYVSGASISFGEISHAWRDTTQLFVWDAPMYQGLYETVRKVNAKLPRSRRLRLIMSEPPIDWSKIHRASDIKSDFGYRDNYYFSSLQQNVLQRARHALLIFGSTHLVHAELQGPSASKHPGLGVAITRAAPGKLMILWSFFGTVQGFRNPAVVPIQKSPLYGHRGSEIFPNVVFFRKTKDGLTQTYTPAPESWPLVESMIDGLLYLGEKDAQKEASPCLYFRDPAYLAEVQRRAVILEHFYGGGGYVENAKQLAVKARASPCTGNVR